MSFIYAGYDNIHGFQLYQSNPSGNYGGWKATSVGANNASAQSLLKQDYKDEMNLKEACTLAVKVLSKTMDSTTLSSEKGNPPTCPFITYIANVGDGLTGSGVCDGGKEWGGQDLFTLMECSGD